MTIGRAELLAVLADYLPERGCVAAPLEQVPSRSASAIVLLDDELSEAGEHAEALVAEAARILRPHGVLAATACNRVFAAATGADLGRRRGFAAAELGRLLGHFGFAVELLCAAGAGERLAGRDAASVDVDIDRQPGLLDAAPRLVVAARASRDEPQRSERFFGSLPRKVVAAAVLCRDESGRILVVHDRFKGAWTMPGGVVDADEDPRSGAAREAWEEAGVAVDVGPPLGVFSAPWPDRLILVYAATPSGGGSPTPTPVHAHEIDGAAWVDPGDALAMVAPRTRFQLERCLDEAGGTWRLEP